MSQQRQPWFKFHTVDWRGDTGIRRCSLAARGLWIEMLALMHEAHPYGHLVVAGEPPSERTLSRLLSTSERSLSGALRELEQHAVLSRTEGGVIYSRRMVRDRQKQEESAINGAKGGSPLLGKRVNPPVIPDSPQIFRESVNPSDKPARAHARLASDLSSSSGSGSSEREPEREPRQSFRSQPLMRGPMLGNVAIPGRVPFMASLLSEFALKVGGADAEARVLAWAHHELEALGDGPIAGSADTFGWWRARAAATLLPAPRPSTRADRVSQANQEALAAVLARSAQ